MVGLHYALYLNFYIFFYSSTPIIPETDMRLLRFMLLALLLSVSGAAQWELCPFGEVDDPYPGLCGRYADSDSDGLCDYSQPDPQERESPTQESTTSLMPDDGVHDLVTGKQLKTMTVLEAANIYGIDATDYALALGGEVGETVAIRDRFQSLRDKHGLEPNIAKEIAAKLAGEHEVSTTTVQEIENQVEAPIPRYNLWQWTAGLTLSYIASIGLVRAGKISIVGQRMFWNIMLTASFLASALLGVLLVIRINTGWSPNLPFNMLFWHVEAGIAMAVVTVFHILWHIRYYSAIIQRVT